MYAVQCPKCKRLLRMKHPFQRGKLRCPNCGAVFLPSAGLRSKPIQPPPPRKPPAGDSAEGHKDNQSRPKRRSHGPIFVVGFFAIASIAAIIGGWYFASYPYVEVRDSRGKVIFKGRVSTDEAKRLRERARREEQDRKAKIDKEAPAAGETQRKPRKAPRLPKPPRAGLQQQLKAQQGVQSDPNLVVFVTWYAPHGGADGYLIGEVQNTYDHALSKLAVAVDVMSPGGQRLDRFLGGYQYVPPKAAMPFSIKYANLPPEEIGQLVATVTSTRTASNELCWQIDPTECRQEIDGSVFRLKGRTRNRSDQTVKDVKIYCDFFDGQSVRLGSAVGTLDDKPAAIAPGEYAFFTVEFDTTGREFLPQFIERVVARAVGRKF